MGTLIEPINALSFSHVISLSLHWQPCSKTANECHLTNLANIELLLPGSQSQTARYWDATANKRKLCFILTVA